STRPSTVWSVQLSSAGTGSSGEASGLISMGSSSTSGRGSEVSGAVSGTVVSSTEVAGVSGAEGASWAQPASSARAKIRQGVNLLRIAYSFSTEMAPFYHRSAGATRAW